jgi:hypothetical protein
LTAPERTIPWDKYTAYREVTAHPAAFGEERFGLDTLRKAARQAEVLFRGWPFIFSDERFTRTRSNRVETIVDVSDIRGHDYFETWQLWQSGLFFHRSLMDEAADPDAVNRGKMIDFVMTVYHIGEAIGSLWRLYSALKVEDDEVITIEFRYTDAKDRRLETLDFGRAPIRTAQPCADVEVVRRREVPLSVWRASDAQITAEIAIEVFQRFGWIEPNRAEISKIANEFLAKPRF